MTGVLYATTPAPFPPQRCRGDVCEYRADHDMVIDVPIGPKCGEPAAAVIYWRDGRFSPACAKHGAKSLDADARRLVLCIHAIPEGN